MKLGYYDYKLEQPNISYYERLYLLPTVKWIKQEQPTFEQFLKKKYTLPYCDWSILDHSRMNYIISFEKLNEDFKTALTKIGLQPVRNLPQKNVTKEKASLADHLSSTSRAELERVFGPFLKEQHLEHYLRAVDISEATHNKSLSYSLSKATYRIYYSLVAGNSK